VPARQPFQNWLDPAQAARRRQGRLEAACGRGLQAGIATYKGLRNILEARLDQVKDEPLPPFVPTPHALIRGEGYYH